MNKKLIISLGLIAALTATVAAYAESTTIYTDGIGRMHFLGRDAANNKNTGANYSNSAEQDLTRKLYEKSESDIVNDTSYDQHPLKNYENTFPDSRFGTAKFWRTKYDNGAADASLTNGAKNKTTVTTTKGATDYSGQYQYGTTFINNETDKNVVKTTTKKHWWNRKK